MRIKHSCTRPIVVFGNCSVIHVRTFYAAAGCKSDVTLLRRRRFPYLAQHFRVSDVQVPGLT